MHKISKSHGENLIEFVTKIQPNIYSNRQNPYINQNDEFIQTLLKSRIRINSVRLENVPRCQSQQENKFNIKFSGLKKHKVETKRKMSIVDVSYEMW